MAVTRIHNIALVIITIILLCGSCISQDETSVTTEKEHTSGISDEQAQEQKDNALDETEDKISKLSSEETVNSGFGENVSSSFISNSDSEEIKDPAVFNETVNSTVEVIQSSAQSFTNDSTADNEENTNVTSVIVNCVTYENSVPDPVELVNSSRFAHLLTVDHNVTNRKSPAKCVGALFYAQYCPFSSMAAPHFNALARAFPDIKMIGVDAIKYHNFNTQFGIVGVPTLMIFHNGRPAAKFNDSEYTLEIFSKFFIKYTGLEPKDKLYVTSADFTGPLPSVPTKEMDYCLVMSWIFILICGVYFFSKSSLCTWIIETVQNTWREAEAEHEHVE